MRLRLASRVLGCAGVLGCAASAPDQKLADRRAYAAAIRAPTDPNGCAPIDDEALQAECLAFVAGGMATDGRAADALQLCRNVAPGVWRDECFFLVADSGRSPKAVVPFGGREPRLGTNPFCMAIPSNLDAPFVLDMATSAAAAGKIKVASAKGEMVPSGWLLDADGRPSNDPKVLKQGGALLPLGGAEGFKGYGLSAMVEVMSGILTGLGFGVDPKGVHNDGCFLAAFSVEAFRSLEVFKQDVTDFANYLSSTPPAEGFDRVYYPGELEHQRSQARLDAGLEIDDSTWNELAKTAQAHGVAFP